LSPALVRHSHMIRNKFDIAPVPVVPRQPSPARTDSVSQHLLTELSFIQNEKSRFLRMTQNPIATEPEKEALKNQSNRPALVDFNFLFLQNVNRS